MWLRVQTSREAITADFEAMHSKGITGAILYDSGVGGGMEVTQRMVVGNKEYVQQPTSDFAGAHFTPIPEPAMPSWQPKSREMVRFAASEAARLGMKLVLTVGLPGTSGGMAPEDSQQLHLVRDRRPWRHRDRTPARPPNARCSGKSHARRLDGV